MQVLTLTELMRLTRIELYALAARITTELAKLPEDSPDRNNALINLRKYPCRPGAARSPALKGENGHVSGEAEPFRRG